MIIRSNKAKSQQNVEEGTSRLFKTQVDEWYDSFYGFKCKLTSKRDDLHFADGVVLATFVLPNSRLKTKQQS